MNKMARLGYKPDDQVEMTVHKLTLAPSVCPSSYHAPSAAWLWISCPWRPCFKNIYGISSFIFSQAYKSGI